jgi:signal peptidase II
MATIESPHRAPARDSWRHYRLLLGLSGILFIVDQLTKWWIVEQSGLVLHAYPPFGGIEVVPGVFNIVYAVNYGAAWGMLSGHGWLFLVIAIAALFGLFWYRRALELARTPYAIAFGLIIGGIVGNALDRVMRGHVVDFLDVDLQFYRWPTFNIADSGIVVGTLWLILFSQLWDRTQSPEAGSPPSS